MLFGSTLLTLLVNDKLFLRRIHLKHQKLDFNEVILMIELLFISALLVKFIVPNNTELQDDILDQGNY